MLDRPRYEADRTGRDGDVTEILDLENDICPLASQAMDLGGGFLCCGGAQEWLSDGRPDFQNSLWMKVEDWADKSDFRRVSFPAVLSGTGAGDSVLAVSCTPCCTATL
ncbi:MAG: hypothetical protein ACLTI1_11075 [Clostridia bacterium]